MTTAAPPEKMRDAELIDSLSALRLRILRGQQPTGDDPATITEAARRLAPRVGDDGPDCNCQTEDACKDKPGCKMRKGSPPPAASADERVDREALMGVIAAGMNEYVMEGPAGLARRIEQFILERDRLSALPKGQEHEG